MGDEAERREGGAWIGQHPDENTARVRDGLDESAERVSITDNQPGHDSEAEDERTDEPRA